MDKFILFGSAAVVAMVANSPVYAQAGDPRAATTAAGQISTNPEPDTGQVADIVVTAQKRSENIQNVPLSIQAVSGEQMTNAGINDASQLGKLVPSLQISNADIFAASISVRIRGFGTPGTDSDVAAYLDGVFVPRPGTILSSFLDVKSVEVLNGPQGTLFGRNAAMGAISISTNVPSRESSLSLVAEGGSYGSYAGTVIGNTPLGDNAALRVAMKYSHTDGFYENNLDGRTYGRKNDFVGRAYLLLNLASNLTWTVRLDGAKRTGDGAYPQGVDTLTATPQQLSAMTGFLALFGAPPPVYSNRPSRDYNQLFTDPKIDDRQVGVTSDLRWELSPELSVRLINGYRDWKSYQLVGDTISTALDLLNVSQEFRSKAQSHELQLVSARDAFLDGKLGFTSGLYYFDEDYSIDTVVNLGSQFCPILVGGFAPFLVGACQAAPQQSAGTNSFTQNTESYAAYGQVNYNITPTLSVDLGLRYTWDRKHANLLNVANNAIALFPLEVSEGPYDFRLKEHKPSYRASVSWQVAPRVLAFATFSTGYKSGGINASTSGTVPLPPSLRYFGSESVRDFELGFKSVFLDGKAQLNASVFDTRLNDFQDRTFSGTQFLTRNSGDVRSRGVDLDARFRPVPALTLRLAGTYLDAKYIRNTNAPGLEGCTGTPSCPLVQDLSGKRLQFSPKLQFNGGFDWQVAELGTGYRITASGNEHYTSSFLTSNTDNPGSRLPGYWTSDLTVALTAPSDRWKIEFFATNLFDKRYYVATIPQVLGALLGVNDTTNGATLYRGFLGDPRKIGARASINF